MRLWRLAQAAYRLQHWDSAQRSLTALQTDFSGSPFSALYRQLAERIRVYRSTPPPPFWDGITIFDSK